MNQESQNMEHIVNQIPGGIVICRIQDGQFQLVFFSDGLPALGGYCREEFSRLTGGDLLHLIAPTDRARFRDIAEFSRQGNEEVSLLLEIQCKDGSLRTCHFNGRWQDREKEPALLQGIFTELSAQSHLLQSIANETADGIYVIRKDTYELLYSNEDKKLFQSGESYIGKKCYSFLHGQDSPCSFCTLKTHPADGTPHRMPVEANGKFYDTSFREINWNGIPAYAKYVQDVTEDILLEADKARLEQYFQTVLRYLPGDAAVVRHESKGIMFPEYLSDGFADMVGMSKEDAWEMYKTDAMSGVHPEDKEQLKDFLNQCIEEGREHYEMAYRLRKGSQGYIWVKAAFTVIPYADGCTRVYVIYHDITKDREEQEHIREQYRTLILQHYMTPRPNDLILGHCNVTRNRIMEIVDNTHSNLLEQFGYVREEFFKGISTLIPDPAESEEFLSKYLNAPSLQSFEKGETEVLMTCYLKLPTMELGRYVQFKVNLVEAPDTKDVTGILTVTDITEKILSDKILRRVSLTSYDIVAEISLFDDKYRIINARAGEGLVHSLGTHSHHIQMLKEHIIPRDQERAVKMLDSAYMLERLQTDDSYSFSCGWHGNNGEILSKNLTVSAIDLKLGRVCLTRTDITDYVREQQGLLNMIAYTFELAGFVAVDTGCLTMYTREIVLKNLAPYVSDNYEKSMDSFILQYGAEERKDEIRHQFRLADMVNRLKESPGGYDFVYPYQAKEELRYKQINVLWGDESHQTICLVRADVTDVLAEEKKAKIELEQALALAEDASRAKSDFLSSMSHDIRTPMNAIIGMTTLAMNHLDSPQQMEEYLQKISVSSKHLLSLINNILDMSQIERSKIQLSHMPVSIHETIEQVCSIMAAQTQTAGFDFSVQAEDIRHPWFYGDTLRINQILINLLSNAFKFTPEGGCVTLSVKEITPLKAEGTARYLYTVRDTGIGMTEEFITRIFAPFERSSTTARIEGSGLGLNITKGLVELMGGTIKVESRLHQGTTFQIELEHEIAQEIAKEKEQETGPTDSNNMVLSGRRFLVVEDNAINSEILCELLKMHGAESVVRENGLLGVKEFENTPPQTYDAILMDIQMPVMNGFAATKEIRRLPRPDAGTIPIIAMTANAFAEDVQAALEAGMNAHAAKPVDIAVLCGILEKLLKAPDPS